MKIIFNKSKKDKEMILHWEKLDVYKNFWLLNFEFGMVPILQIKLMRFWQSFHYFHNLCSYGMETF